MIKKTTLLLLFFFSSFHLFSWEIGIMIEGQGEYIYSKYGHAGFVVKGNSTALDNLLKKSLYRSFHTETILFDYGNFSFADKDFYYNFFQGKLAFLKLATPFYEFEQYNKQVSHRELYILWLNLTDTESQQIVNVLFQDIHPKNNTYMYKYIEDNCATRLRDILDNALQHRIREQSQDLTNMSFMKYFKQPLFSSPFFDLAFSYLGGEYPNSHNATVWDSMFLPAYLAKELQEITKQDGSPLVRKKEVIFQSLRGKDDITVLPRGIIKSKTLLTISLITLLISSLLLFLSFYQKKKIIYRLRVVIIKVLFSLLGLISLLSLLFAKTSKMYLLANNIDNLSSFFIISFIILFLPLKTVQSKNNLWFRQLIRVQISLLLLAQLLVLTPYFHKNIIYSLLLLFPIYLTLAINYQEIRKKSLKSKIKAILIK